MTDIRTQPVPDAKHTPGPWFFEGKPNFGECYVRTGQQPEGGQLYICALPTDSKKNKESRAELDANGVLIAAAPELFDALKGVLDHWAQAYEPLYEGAKALPRPPWLDAARTAYFNAGGG